MKKLFTNLLFILFSITLLFPSIVYSKSLVAIHNETLTKEKWRQDLQYLSKELMLRHKNIFHTVSREEFERAVAELDSEIPSLQEPEIILRLQQIISMIGDSHTSLADFPPNTFHWYPLALFWFGNELRVLRTTSTYNRALGGKVVRIGNSNIADAVVKVNRFIAKDNEYWGKYVGANYLVSAEVLFTAGILSSLDKGQWTFEDTEGKQFSVDMNVISKDDKGVWLLAAKETPLFRQKAAEQFWFTTLNDSKTLYVNMRGYPETEAYKQTADALLKLIDSFKPKRLVIDVRQNTGGDLKKGRYLLAGLKKRNVFNKQGIYVVIGRATSSAAMVNAIDFRSELNAVLVGEPTGGKPNSYSENEFFFLPNSNLKVSYSTKYYKFQESDTSALMPDKLIEPSWESYKSGGDNVMEWILAQPLGK